MSTNSSTRNAQACFRAPARLAFPGQTCELIFIAPRAPAMPARPVLLPPCATQACDWFCENYETARK